MHKLITSILIIFSFLWFASTSSAQNDTIVRDHRTETTVRAERKVRDHRAETTVRDHRTKSVSLTTGECTQLGGEEIAVTTTLCKSGAYCKRVGAGGEIYRVCTSKAAEVKAVSPATSRPRPSERPAFARPAFANESVFASPLTKAECIGLGGEFRGSSECSEDGKGDNACITVDGDGVIRVVCEKAEK